MLGLGAVILGVMMGVVAISWFKTQCLPDEEMELGERDERLELERDLGHYNPATLHSDFHSQGEQKLQAVLYVENPSQERREERREELPIKCETDF